MLIFTLALRFAANGCVCNLSSPKVRVLVVMTPNERILNDL